MSELLQLLLLPSLLLSPFLSLADASSSSSSCPDGWRLGPSKNKCFMHVSSSLSWNKSEVQCMGLNAHLAALTSSEDLNFALELCSTGSKNCWVGGRGFKSSAGYEWKWSDGMSHWNDSAFPGQPLLLNCTSSSCHTNGPSESCTLVTSGLIPLVGEDCNSKHGFLCTVDSDGRCHHKHCHVEYLIILAVVSGLILFTTLALVVWLLLYRRRKKKRRSRKVSNPSAAALVPPSWKVFTSEELRSITKNFSEGNRLLGDAKTGGTYTGTSPDGLRVAVKRLKRSNLQRKKEFYSEVGRVARLHHPNLVAVKGCCYDHGDRFIVYEFVANGPLDRWLHHVPIGGRILDWKMRMKIATTLAQGIAYVLLFYLAKLI